MYWNLGLVPGKYFPFHLRPVFLLLAWDPATMSCQVKVCLIFVPFVGSFGYGFGPKSGSTVGVGGFGFGPIGRGLYGP
jgi:hypothetical protein